MTAVGMEHTGKAPRIRVAYAAVACVAVSVSVHSLAQTADALVPLFDGRTLSGWTIENTQAGNFTVAGGVLRVEGPGGWLRSERRYGDFSLRTEFRFLTPDADSGIFVRAAAGSQFGRGWPGNAYQVQLRVPSTPSRLPPVGGLFRHGTAAGETSFDPALVEKLFTGVGQWQVLEIDVAGDTLRVRFNGTEVTRAANILNSPGYVGVQGETGALEYRAIEIRER
jgi:hypothetical protein